MPQFCAGVPSGRSFRPAIFSFVSVLAFAGAMAAVPANAQLAQNLLIGNAKALSLGNAVTADPPGIDSVHFNPAGLSRYEGSQRQIKLIAADVSVEGEFTGNANYDCLFDAACAKDRYGYAQPLERDPYENTKSTVEKFAVYLPGKGITPLPFIAAPLGGASYHPPSSTLTFGTSVYAPLILGFVRGDDDPGKFYGKELGLTRITYFSPTVAWQINDRVQLGLGVGFSYFGVGLNLDYRAPNPFVNSLGQLLNGQCQSQGSLAGVNICNQSQQSYLKPFEKIFTLDAAVEEPMSPSYNIGVLVKATSWLTWGLVYQSETSDRLQGDINVLLSDNIVGLLNSIAGSNVGGIGFENIIKQLTGIDKGNNGRITSKGYVDVTMPRHIATGISMQVTPVWKLNVDYKWTQTSSWDNLSFYFNEPLAILRTLQPISGVEPDALIIPRGYRDAHNFAFGLEYQYSDRVALRAGYEPRKSGIPDDKRDFLIPLGDMKLYGLGAGITLARDRTVDIAIGYTKSDQFIPAGSSTNGNDTRADSFVYNPSAGMDVRSVLKATLLELSYQDRF